MNDEGVRVKSLWRGALLLTLAAIITKILSAAYRIPYQNIAGDVGFYVYQQVYPFYGIALILSLYGFPVAISKVISEQILIHNKESVFLLIKHIFYRLLLFSIIGALILIVSAPYIAKMMGDEQLTTLLQITAFSFLAIPFLSCYRGYFQGVDQMAPTAISQVLEQGIRVIGILAISFFLVTLGYGPYGAGLGATIGSIMGATAGIGVLTYYFFREKKKLGVINVQNTTTNAPLLKKIFINSLLFSMSALVLVLFQLVDSFTVLRFLYVHGVEEETGKVVKGIYDRGQPLIQLGTIVTTAFALTIVPLISRVIANNDLNKAKRYSELSLRLTLFIGLCASFGLAIIIEPVNAMLFVNREGSVVLSILAFSILFSSLIVTTSAILQGYDCTLIAARNLILGLILKILINTIFISLYGVIAAAFATVLGLAFITLLNLSYIYRKHQADRINKQLFMRLGLTLVVMVSLTLLWKNLFESLVYEMTRGLEAILSLSSVGIACIVVVILVIKLEIFSRTEISQIPKLDKLYDKLNRKGD